MENKIEKRDSVNFVRSIPELYVHIFGVCPNRCAISYEEGNGFFRKDKMIKCPTDINIEKIKKEFDTDLVDVLLNKNFVVKEDFGDYHSDDDIYGYSGTGSTDNCLIMMPKMNLMFHVHRYSLFMYYDDYELDAKEYMKKILRCFTFSGRDRKPDVPKISILRIGHGGDFYGDKVEIKKVNVDINEVYNDDFVKAYPELEQFIMSDNSGIAFLSGEPGTGKTNLIRHLINKFKDKDFFFCSKETMSHLGNPAFAGFLNDNKSAIFVLEDCEDVIRSRKNTFNSAISDILNMSDGLMSDVYKIKFICTFNEDISDIDSALLRKGRCKFKYTFGKLKKDKVEKLIKKHHIENLKADDMTLSDIFNRDSDDVIEKERGNKRKKIGF